MTLPDLALIHGWGLGNTAWEPVLPALEQRFRAHLLTLPGYGLPESLANKQSSNGPCQKAHEQTNVEAAHCRTPFDAPSSMSSFTRTAEALTAALPEGCLLCGWSLGSMLALQMALLAPQRLAGIILIGGTPSFTQRADWSDAQPPSLLDTFTEAVAEDAKATLQRFVALFNQDDTQSRAIGRAMTKALFATPLPDTATLLTGLDWLRDVDLRKRATAIVTPTLLIHGENDPLMPLPAARWLAERLPNARLEIFAGAAHAPFLNNPERFATLIGDFHHASALHQATRP